MGVLRVFLAGITAAVSTEPALLYFREQRDEPDHHTPDGIVAGVQHRGGHVPRARNRELVRGSEGPRLRATLAVRSLFSGAWSGLEATFERRLARADVEMIVDCTNRLSAIPVT